MSKAGKCRNGAEDKVTAGMSKGYRISSCHARLPGATSPQWEVEIGENNIYSAH